MVVVSLLASGPVQGHHSFSAEYDASKPLRLTGTVSRMVWTNPHAHIFVDIKDQRGKTTTWAFELGTPNDLMRGGWLKRSVKPGDTVTVHGYAARDGSPSANARVVLSSDGRTLFARRDAVTFPAPDVRR
jgi:hypothetical protein